MADPFPNWHSNWLFSHPNTRSIQTANQHDSFCEQHLHITHIQPPASSTSSTSSTSSPPLTFVYFHQRLGFIFNSSMKKSSLRASRYEESLSSLESHSRHAPPIVSAAAPITMDYLWGSKAVKPPNCEAIVSFQFAPKILLSVYPRGHQKAIFPTVSVIVPKISGLWRYTIILLSFVFSLFQFF